MIQPTVTDTPTPSLRDRLDQLRKQNPRRRMRDLADELNVSEGALTAACCGREAVRLKTDWVEFLHDLNDLGPVMALTRNHAIVHEKDGVFDHVGFIGHMAQVVNHDIDLRIFLRHWQHLFAVEQPSHGRILPSFQVYDGEGHAVHKIYLRDESRHDAYRRIVQKHRHADQSPAFHAEAVPPTPTASRDEIDIDQLRERWKAMKDTHDFFPMIRQLGLTRHRANALAGEDLARPLPASALETLLNTAAAEQVPIMVFVGNRGCIQIHTGPIHNIERMGSWLNVLDPGFNLHILSDLVDNAWIVRKPTKDGIVTSFEIFDANGVELAQFFGERKPGRPELPAWRALLDHVTTATEGIAS